MPVNLTSPTPSARPLPGAPSQPRKKPVSCHRASRPRQPGMTGSPLKWQAKNQSSIGLPATSSSATIWPLPCAPPVSEMLAMRSNMSIGGSGSWALPRRTARRGRRPADPRIRSSSGVRPLPSSSHPPRGIPACDGLLQLSAASAFPITLGGCSKARRSRAPAILPASGQSGPSPRGRCGLCPVSIY